MRQTPTCSTRHAVVARRRRCRSARRCGRVRSPASASMDVTRNSATVDLAQVPDQPPELRAERAGVERELAAAAPSRVSPRTAASPVAAGSSARSRRRAAKVRSEQPVGDARRATPACRSASPSSRSRASSSVACRSVGKRVAARLEVLQKRLERLGDGELAAGRRRALCRRLRTLSETRDQPAETSDERSAGDGLAGVIADTLPGVTLRPTSDELEHVQAIDRRVRAIASGARPACGPRRSPGRRDSPRPK